MFAIVLGCSSSVSIPDGAQLICSGASDCPSGYVCHNERCERIGAIDTTPPDLASAPVVSPSVGKAGMTFTIDVVATEPLLVPPNVTLGFDMPVVLTCNDQVGNGYRCTYQATGLEADGFVAFDVWLEDRARNETTRHLAGTLHLDFTPPAVAAASVAYVPDPSNPLPFVARATAGTVVHVAVSANELLDTPTAQPALSVDFGAGPMTFGLVPGSLTETGAAFEAVVPLGTLDGEYVPSVTWTDLAGNVITTSVGMPPIEVKTSQPVLNVNQRAVVFVRSPWGNSAPENLGGYTIPAGPYFALEPSDVLTTSASLPAGTFMLSGGAVPSELLVKNSDQSGALILGTLRPDSSGAYPRQALSSPDLRTVYVVGVDDSGNESAAVKIQNAEWVATPNPPALGMNPNTMEWVGYVSSTRQQETDLHLADPSSLGSAAGADTQVVLARAAAAWLDRTSANLPSVRYGHAMAYDSARGRVVLFGGCEGTSLPQDTWEWNGSAWTQVATIGPTARNYLAMAYDSIRGRVVLFGGYDASGILADTWEWDGSTWTEVATTGPSARYSHAMAYDSVRGRVVLFGGTNDTEYLQDTWEWNGSSWTQVAASSSSPSARIDHAMAFDSVRGRMVLFGGTNNTDYFQDTWEFDGSSWTQVAASSSSPSARIDHAMAFDSVRGRVVLFGGYDPSGIYGTCADTWEFDGSSWTQVAASSGPSARFDHAMAYDGARGRIVLFGGYGPSCTTGVCGDTWELDGSSWTQVAASSGPSARFEHAMAYDSARGRVVLFGGSAPGGSCTSGACGDTWEWDGSYWTQVATTGPSARWSHAMAYDSARHRTVLFGGCSSSTTFLQDTWEWDGKSWAQVAISGPSRRIDHAMAYDSAHGVVLFGGQEFGGLPDGDTWEWDGNTWTRVAINTGPSARANHAMAYDSARGRVVLFGGSPGGDQTVGDTWEWNGSSWTQVAYSGPSPRADHAMAYDSGRQRVVLFGGADVNRDTWEYDAFTMHQPAIQFDASDVAGIDATEVNWVRVRAFAGGTFYPGDTSSIGATLLGWSNGYGQLTDPGAWVPLAMNCTGVATQQPYVPAPPASLIDWQSSSAAEAQRYITSRDGQLSFQVRPSGTAGPDPSGAQVALDYIEVRVRYSP